MNWQHIGKLYSDNSTLVWNGNCVTGGEKVKEFLTNLPPSENTAVHSLDCQPVSGKMYINYKLHLEHKKCPSQVQHQR